MAASKKFVAEEYLKATQKYIDAKSQNCDENDSSVAKPNILTGENVEPLINPQKKYSSQIPVFMATDIDDKIKDYQFVSFYIELVEGGVKVCLKEKDGTLKNEVIVMCKFVKTYKKRRQKKIRATGVLHGN